MVLQTFELVYEFLLCKRICAHQGRHMDFVAWPVLLPASWNIAVAVVL